MAGYVVCVVLAFPLLVLGLFFAGLLGPLGLAVGATVTALCAAVVFTARRHAEQTQDLHGA